MLKRLTPYLLLLLASSQVFGQEASSCTQTLRLAQTTYENGRLHQLEEILSKCLNDGFNQEERRQGYKLLVQSYIYLEEPEKADAAMLNLLSTDQFFRPNPDVDPAEFVSLYNRFRTDPLFRWGIKLGPAINSQLSTTQFGVGADAEGTATFAPLVSFSMGLVFEKDFLAKKRLTIAPEVVYAVRGYKENGIAFRADSVEGTPSANRDTQVGAVIKRKSIDFNALVKWWLSKDPESRDTKVEPYLIGGPGVSFMISTSLEDSKLERKAGDGTTTGPSLDVKSAFKPVLLSAIVGGGARIRLSQVFVHLDVRFDFGLMNAVNKEGRTVDEPTWDFAWTPNDARMNMMTINLGLQIAQFNPKKLIK